MEVNVRRNKYKIIQKIDTVMPKSDYYINSGTYKRKYPKIEDLAATGVKVLDAMLEMRQIGMANDNPREQIASTLELLKNIRDHTANAEESK